MPLPLTEAIQYLSEAIDAVKSNGNALAQLAIEQASTLATKQEEIGRLSTSLAEAEAEIERLKNPTPEPDPDPDPEPQPRAVGPRDDRGVTGIRIDGWDVLAGGSTYAWWMERCRDVQAKNFVLRGNSGEATCRFGGGLGIYSEDILLADGEIWGMDAPKWYTDLNRMPKSPIVFQAVKRGTVRGVKTHGAGPGVGTIAKPEHASLAGMVNEDILFDDCDFYPDDDGPMRGVTIEVAIGSRRVTYQNIRLHEAGELSNGKALFDIGGQVDHHGSRKIEHLTLRGITGTMRFKGVPIVRDNGNPNAKDKDGNPEPKGGMEEGLLIEDCDITLMPGASPIRWPLATLVFPQGWKPGWVCRNSRFPGYGNSHPVEISGVRLTAAQFNALPGVSNVSFA